MTPEEYAEQVVSVADDVVPGSVALSAGACRLNTFYDLGAGHPSARLAAESLRGALVCLIADAVRKAVAEEREACAKVADDYATDNLSDDASAAAWRVACEIAGDIRARAQP